MSDFARLRDAERRRLAVIDAKLIVLEDLIDKALERVSKLAQMFPPKAGTLAALTGEPTVRAYRRADAWLDRLGQRRRELWEEQRIAIDCVAALEAMV